MTNEELKNLIQRVQEEKAEAQVIEVKSANGGCPKRLYDTLSSFSNQDSGGTILFGLNEEKAFETVGVYDVQDLQKKVTEQCNQMEPPVRAEFTSLKWGNDYIVCAEIPPIEFTERPCYYKKQGKVKGSYVRVGDADLPMTDLEVYSYDQYRKHVHDDERPIERADFTYLKKDEINAYVMQKKINRPRFSQLSENQVFELLSLTKDSIPTLAAVMSFGIYPQGFLPQLGITAIVVPGKEVGDLSVTGSRFLNNKRIEGTLDEMLDGAISFCMYNMKIETKIDDRTGEREDRTEYPIDAIREAILNALIHRDYSIYTEGTPIQMYFFEDRFEIHSPGELYGNLTVDDLGVMKPDLRNPTLATMSEYLLKTENRYSGIPTIRNKMKEAGLPEPVFQNRRNEFVVIFYNKKMNEIKGKTEDEESLMEFCKTPRTRNEIMEYLGLKTTFYVTQNYINPLLEKGLLRRTIPDKPKSKNQKYYSVRNT